MDDVPNQSVPSIIADQALSGSRARTAHSKEAPLKRYGPPAALTACLVGLACLGWSNIQRPARIPSKAEINLPTQKTLEESGAQRAEVEARRAAQSLNTKEVGAPEPAKRGLESAKDGAGIAEAAGKTSHLPPKPVEGLADGGEKVDRIGLKIAALLAGDPVVDHSGSATLARRWEQRARHDAFDPSQHPNARGAPRPLGTIRSTAAANKGSADYAYRQPAD